MELKDYEKMSISELRNLYFKLTTIVRDVLIDNKECIEELAIQSAKREDLISRKNQVLEIINSKSIAKEQKAGRALTAITGVLGTGTLLIASSNSLSQAVVGTGAILTLGCGLGAYTAFNSSSYDQRLVDNDNILFLNPRISEVERKIIRIKNNIRVNNQILERANSSLHFLNSRIKELSEQEQRDTNKQNTPTPKPSIIQRTLSQKSSNNK